MFVVACGKFHFLLQNVSYKYHTHQHPVCHTFCIHLHSYSIFNRQNMCPSLSLPPHWVHCTWPWVLQYEPIFERVWEVRKSSKKEKESHEISSTWLRAIVSRISADNTYTCWHISLDVCTYLVHTRLLPPIPSTATTTNTHITKHVSPFAWLC